jgi:hypothetical protein
MVRTLLTGGTGASSHHAAGSTDIMRETTRRKYYDMETIKLTTNIDDTGTLRLELPTRLANHEVEVLVVLHPTTEQVTGAQGWPAHYFEVIDAIDTDDVIVRPDQGIFEEREMLD